MGITTLLPLSATLPMPWSILTVVAPETLQLSVDDSPAEIVGGLAPNEFIAADWLVVVRFIPAKSQPAANSNIRRMNGINFFMLHLREIFLSERRSRYDGDIIP
jgi:hypothetical protein